MIQLHYDCYEEIIMVNGKANVNVEIDEQLIVATINNVHKKVELTTDENGNIMVNKEQYPDIYDWAVNG